MMIKCEQRGFSISKLLSLDPQNYVSLRNYDSQQSMITPKGMIVR